MLNFFEQPWTLIGTAVLVLFAVFTFRSVLPEERRRWQWLLPLGVAALALGLDYIVKTDREKINSLIHTVMQAVEQESCALIDATIADDYRDSFHSTKAELMRHCRQKLSRPLIAKNSIRGMTPPAITPPTATVTLFTTTHFEKDSYVARDYYTPLAQFKVELHFRKQPDKSWLITRINPLEANKQPIKWRQI
ncbi:MAG: hypothetical protein KAY65_03450 [Planctomycetes bacterium]|nr:hypothetical protein [Planctomycetota bacterium]